MPSFSGQGQSGQSECAASLHTKQALGHVLIFIQADPRV